MNGLLTNSARKWARSSSIFTFAAVLDIPVSKPNSPRRRAAAVRASPPTATVGSCSARRAPRLAGRRKQRLALVTDAWHPQTNGVVNTLSRLVKHLEAAGMDVLVISPEGYRTAPFPSYPEVRVVCNPWRALRPLREFRPDAVHIATEGPLGLWVRSWLGREGLCFFTTSFHTRFPSTWPPALRCLWSGVTRSRGGFTAGPNTLSSAPRR